MSETLPTKKELETAKKKIKSIDFITITREGLPSKTFYEIIRWWNSNDGKGVTIFPDMGGAMYSKIKETTTKTTTKNILSHE